MVYINEFFRRPLLVFTAAILFRLALLIYGRFQDAYSAVKYTDIDYLVFTDAARLISWGRSPYDRATYRYTPLLAWLLYPTTWGGLWFEFGKALFAAGDVVTGWLIMLIMRAQGMPTERALKYASIWLLNPMVANISTRGSSEGLLAVIVVALLWAVLQRHVRLAGVFLGLGVHFKIYPFIYAASIFWWLDRSRTSGSDNRADNNTGRSILMILKRLLSGDRLNLTIFSLVTFTVLNVIMYRTYEQAFIEHTFLYHVTRVDHRHNFSVYNTLLHLNSASSKASVFHIESLAFFPQLFLSVVVVPLVLAKKDLPSTMLAQTFAFVTFNKVCTSQYFLWYLVFLPFYLPTSSLLQRPKLGVTAVVLWIVGQAWWLRLGYELEFLGNSTFVPGLWLTSLCFFAINCWILGILVEDIGRHSTAPQATEDPLREKEHNRR